MFPPLPLTIAVEKELLMVPLLTPARPPTLPPLPVIEPPATPRLLMAPLVKPNSPTLGEDVLIVRLTTVLPRPLKLPSKPEPPCNGLPAASTPRGTKLGTLLASTEVASA